MTPSFEDIIKEAYKQKYELRPRSIDLHKHPKVRDEVVSVFISAMMGIIVESWEAFPCVRKKMKQPQSRMEHEDTNESSNNVTGEENRESSIVQLEDALKRSAALKKEKPHEEGLKANTDNINSETASNNNPFSPSQKEEYKSKIMCATVPSYASEWIAVSADPTILTEDWRFYEGDQIALITFKNGNKYRGRLSRNVMHGEGEFFWANGTVYKGDFNCGDIVGTGHIQWPDSSWYQGDMYYGYRHGSGMLVLPEFLAYSGEWVQGIRHGEGLLLYDCCPLKSCYDVTWNKGVCCGNGLRIYPSGAQYDGQWKNGQRDGFGIMIWSNVDVYIGDWVGGKIEGVGKYIWYGFLTNNFVVPVRNSYYGTWKANNKDGVGILETISGVCVKGEWLKDMKHGYAKIICRNGIVIENSQIFTYDHLNAITFDENHPWVFMMKLDNTNIMKHCARNNGDIHGYVTEQTVRGNKPNNNKDTVMSSDGDSALYKGNSDGSKNIASIVYPPITVPDEFIDLSHYLKRLTQNQDIIQKPFRCNRKENDKKLFDELKTLNLNLRICRNSVSVKRFAEYNPKESIKFYKFEAKWVRNVISRHLPYLKKLFNDYATLLYTERLNYAVLLPRLLLWQMFRDIKIQKRGLTLSGLDKKVQRNPSTLIEDIKSPFEKLKFFQFLHYLIELSWNLYGKHSEGLEDTPGILASAFEKLIEDDIKPNARNHSGTCLLIHQNLLPLNDLYNFYCMHNINTTRKFLAMIINEKSISRELSESTKSPSEEVDTTMSEFNNGRYKNIYDIGDKPIYKKMKLKSPSQLNCEKILIPVVVDDNNYEEILKENEENAKDINDDILDMVSQITETDNTSLKSSSGHTNLDEDREHSGLNKYSLKNINILTAMKCINEVCPSTKSGSLIVNMDYNITFLEFYEMLILCALKSIEIDKALKEKKSSQETKEVKQAIAAKETLLSDNKNKKSKSKSSAKK